MIDAVLDPDVEQRAAADPAASVWVAASAGAGKTKVLTDRVLRLLLAGTAPDRILCLTFTRAAAAEMANRLNKRLGEWATTTEGALLDDLERLTGMPASQDMVATARRLFARVLDAPGRLKILTIHAFAQSLLRRFPLESGVPPHFDVLDERSAAEMLEEARDTVLAAARDAGNPDDGIAAALAVITERATENTFAKVLGAVLGDRDRLRRLIAERGGLGGAVAATAALLGVAPDDTVDGVTAAACADAAFDAPALRAAAAALESGSEKDRSRAAAILDWVAAAPVDRMQGFALYCRAFLAQTGARLATLATKPVCRAHPEAHAALLAEAARLEAVLERTKAVTTFRETAALLRLANAIVEAYDRLKERRAVLDYDDQILLVRDLLDRPGIAPWILFKLDGGLDHILVDEAQDNSPEQWRIVARLSEEFFAGEGARDRERTVFAVGDAKQSIFSFQRADPGGFTRMRAHFDARVRAAERTWRRVDLAISFRSTEAVLRAVDAVFAGETARDGVAEADAPASHAVFRQGAAGLVELWPAAAPVEIEEPEAWAPPVVPHAVDTPEARLADAIAGRVQRWLRDGERLEARNRAVRPGDILVLVRRRNAFVEALVRAFRVRDIPVAGVDRMVLSEQMAVMDLVALGEFLLLPEDDLTLATVLKGPFIEFDDMLLFDLAHGRGGAPLWQVLWRRCAERPEFAAAHDFLARLLARTDFVPPYELYARLLEAEGGRRRLVTRLGTEANDPIDEFLSLALDFERRAPPSLQGFLHWFVAGASVVKRDLEHGAGEVRVMTVHGAKGLQAPIVFLPDTMQVPQPDTEPLWTDDPLPAFVWPARKEACDGRTLRVRENARRGTMQEYNRLLYVAMTRAEDRLYVCGWRGTKAPPEACWYHLVEAGLKGVAEPFEFAIDSEEGRGWSGTGWRLANPQTATVAPPEALGPEEAPPPLPDWALGPPAPEPEPPRPLAPSRPDSDEPPPEPLASTGGIAAGRGRIVHRLLQSLPDAPPEQRASLCRRFLARPRHGLDENAQAELAREVTAVLDDPDFAPLFAPGSRAEVPVTAVVGGRALSGRIDRLAVRDHEILIVDYKTNRLPPATVDDIAEIHLRQMAAYRAALRRIYPAHDVRAALLWTEGPRLMPLPDALLDRWAP